MLIDCVPGLDNCRSSAFSGNRMATHRVYFGYYGDTQFGIYFRNCNGGPQSGAASTNQQNIMRRDVHSSIPPPLNLFQLMIISKVKVSEALRRSLQCFPPTVNVPVSTISQIHEQPG